MMTIEATQEVPLTVWEDGTIRISGSRVTLDSIVQSFKLGATAEQIAHKFPSLKLLDIYATITYYLSHQAEIETYLVQQKIDAEETQRLIESSPLHQDRKSVRERLLARAI